jgi:hypothetical protein
VRIDSKVALATWRAFRVSEGFGPRGTLLGQPGDNHKAGLNALPTYTLTLSQARTTEISIADLARYLLDWAPVFGPDDMRRAEREGRVLVEVCEFRTKECTRTCLGPLGRGGEPKTTRARKLRVRFLVACPDAFMTLLEDELTAAVAKHGAIGCRLNTLSDLDWERIAPSVLDIAGVTFYDYTKRWANRQVPANYALTYSASERTSDRDIAAKVGEGETVAAVFDIKHRPGAKVRLPMVETYAGCRVIDGDVSDERFNDHGVIVGLRAKGLAQTLTPGERHFVKVARPA